MTETTDRRSRLLIETAELESCLSDPNLRVLDCDIILSVTPEGGYRAESGYDNWRQTHIPNSVYVHIGKELSADHPTLRYMLPSAEQFARVMSAKGIGAEHDVVVYARGPNYWATRLFLMFREFGFERVRVLNGGWDNWAAEGRPTTDAPPDWPPARFVAKPAAGGFVGRDTVLSVSNDEASCVINALSPELHRGERVNPQYGRPGHIAGSVNVFFMSLIDPQTNRFLDDDALAERFEEHGALQARRLLAYCGGGISATTVAFALHLLGRDDVQLYDGSLSEWGNEPDLPMAVG